MMVSYYHISILNKIESFWISLGIFVQKKSHHSKLDFFAVTFFAFIFFYYFTEKR